MMKGSFFNMKAAGIVRNLDNVGRLVIPKEMRNVIGINEGDPVEILLIDNEIMVKKYSKGCIFCGNHKEVIEFNGAVICNGCRKVLGTFK